MHIYFLLPVKIIYLFFLKLKIMTSEQKKKILADMNNDAKMKKTSNKGVYNYANIWNDNYLDCQNLFKNECSNVTDFLNIKKGKNFKSFRDNLRDLIDDYGAILTDEKIEKEKKLQTLIKLQLFFENYGNTKSRLSPNALKEYNAYIKTIK